MEERESEGEVMITTEAALYGGTQASGSGVAVVTVCSCGQEIGDNRREHCPRCGCCLN